jgi:sec-independent protein translocase protein TatC
MTTSEQPSSPQDTLISHLLELRDRLLRAVLVIILILVVLFSFANELYTYLATPLLKHMPQGSSMVAIEVASPFLTPFKLVLVASIFVAMPYLLYQFWAFVAPGLYDRERRMVVPLLFSSIALFYAGMAFAYFVVFPLVFGFLTGVAPEGVSVMTDISKYLDFVLKLFFAFGIAFEVPIATILLVWMGMTTPESLAKKRPYIIVGAFVMGMLLTPPDMISQTLLAIPMWVLFELGVIFSRYFVPERERDESETEEDDSPIYATAEEYEAAHPPKSVTLNSDYANAGEDDDYDYYDVSDEELDQMLDDAEAEEQSLQDEDSGQPENEPESGEETEKPEKPGDKS